MKHAAFPGSDSPRWSLVLLGRLLALLVVLGLGAAGASPARAALITPYMTLTGGWSDNVRLTHTPRSDFFLKVGAGITGTWEWPKHTFQLRGGVAYAQYLDLEDLNGFDSANVGFNYKYKPSPRWEFYVSDTYTSTFDKPELSDTGELITVRAGTGRMDRNTFVATMVHHYSPTNRMDLTYTNAYTQGEDESQDTTRYNNVAANWVHRLSYYWELGVGGSYTRTEYDKTPNEDRGRAYTRLTRLVGPNMRAFGQISYAINRATTDETLVQDTRNYEMTSFEFGLNQNASQRFTWKFGAGWSIVSGNSQQNSAANNGFPLLNASLTYRGQKYNLTAYAAADLGQFDYLGDNSGLTVSHRAGITYTYRVSPFQNLTLGADYVRNDYKENPISSLNTQQGIVNSYRFSARYTWQLQRHWRLSLEYSYLNRDAELDSDDRQQNQVLLILYTDYPFRW